MQIKLEQRAMFYASDQNAWFKNEYWSCLALTHCPGLGLLTRVRLMKSFGSAYRAVQEVESWGKLHFIRQDWLQNFQAQLWRQGAWQEWLLSRKLNLGVLLYVNDLYPARLKEIPDAPLYLYCKGDPNLLQQPCLAMVGSRHCSQHGARLAYQLAMELSRSGLSVVSGFAQGIDSQAHHGGLQGPGGSIAVLGTGLDLTYPAGNRELYLKLEQNGLLLTEFAPGTPPEAHNFPRRNRIISALSLGVLVVEAAQRSGSLITAGMALEQGREIFAVPGYPDFALTAGSNELLKQGAVLVRTGQDVLQELAPVLSKEWGRSNQFQADLQQAGAADSALGRPETKGQAKGLSPEEQKLARVLEKTPQAHIDSLVAELGWETQKMSRVLMMLELKGVVKQLSGMYYSLC